ncbi:MAG: molybdenum cofactor guanylyltransferase [Firmicutes bacterium]|nr:molybdenum cofactor guanylyltransferase [Bacillota bacterium]
MTLFKSAVILAGGKSTRMGFDKQMLESGGKRLVDHIITQLESVFEDVMVASSDPGLYDQDRVRIIQDVYKDKGPLGGIHSALLQAQSEMVFVIACDMPFIDIPYINYMTLLLKEDYYHACVTSGQGYLEPFHGFYSRSCLPLLEEELAQGRTSVNRFLRKAKTLIIPEKVASSFLPDWLAFTNLNTPEDYKEYLRGVANGSDQRV